MQESLEKIPDGLERNEASNELNEYKTLAKTIPKGSMYGIFTYIWLIFTVEMYVSKSTSRMHAMG